MALRHVRSALASMLVAAALPACVSGGSTDSPAGDEAGAGADAEALAWWRRPNHHPHKIEPADFAVGARDLAASPPDLGGTPVIADMSRPLAPPDLSMVPGPSPDLSGPPLVADMSLPPPPPDLAAPRDLTTPSDLAMPPQANSDPFGVRKIYPTMPNGREWYLPANAEVASGEWQPNTQVTKVSPGVFSASGAPRMMVVSPQGKPWWRNVEMSGYLRQTANVNFYQDQVPHWEWFARGEEHTNDSIAPNRINLGVAAPQGTVTWPNYPFGGLNSVNHSCLASCYHGHAYPNGKVLFEKEVTHTQGYVYGIATRTVANFADAMNRWFGYKFVLRNRDQNTHVHMEVWVDKDANGSWVMATSADDTGNMNVDDANMNGCTAAPFNYQVNQIVTWAGPWVSFRVDNMTYQFKSLSVREIDPLP